jgi:hypothetical protein
LFISGIAGAVTTCSINAYTNSCGECTFNAQGRMDPDCQAKHQTLGSACLVKDYPLTNTKYLIGMCPQIDTCISRLESCKAAAGTTSHRAECNSDAVMRCFIIADNCVDAANEICANGKNESEAGFLNDTAGGPIKSKPPEEEGMVVVVTEDPIFPFCMEPALILMGICGATFLVGRQKTNK